MPTLALKKCYLNEMGLLNPFSFQTIAVCDEKGFLKSSNHHTLYAREKLSNPLSAWGRDRAALLFASTAGENWSISLAIRHLSED